jgi:hypothetical protein
MSDGFEVINDAADGEGSDSEGGSIGRRRLFQMGAAGVAAVGTAAVANALTASPAGATPGSALVVGVSNTAGSALTGLTGGNGFGVTTPLGGGGAGTTIAVEGSSTGSATFGAIGVKGTGLAGVQGVSNGSNTIGTAGVQGVGSSWNPGVEANNTGFPSLLLAPITTVTLPTGGSGSNKKPFAGSFIVLSDGSLHYAPAAGQWQKLSSPSGFQQGNTCMLANPIRILDTRPGKPAAINPGAPIATGATYGLQITGESVGGVEVPAGAVAVVGNITVVNTTGPGYLTLFPAGASRPTASTINYSAANQVIANGVVMRLSGSGAMDIYAATTTDVVFDATGFIG